MKKWILLVISLSLLWVGVKLYPVIPLQDKPPEPMMVSKENIFAKLKQASQERPHLNYLVLGDSVAQGFGSEKTGPHGYSSLVVKGLGKEEIPLDLVNRGVVGQTSGKLRYYIQKEKVQRDIEKADLISLTIGGNDLLKEVLQDGNPLQLLSEFDRIHETYRQNLSSILSHIRSVNKDAPILITSLYNPISPEEVYYRISNQLLNRWNIGLKKVAYQYPSTYVVDVSKRLRAGKGDWLSDQIHPNDRGYRLIADGILDEIRTHRSASASAR